MAWGLNPRTGLAIAHDVVAAGLAWLAAYLLRFNLDFNDPFFSGVWPTLPWVVATQTAVFLGFGLYRGIWRYASVPDLSRIVIAALVGVTATALMLRFVQLPLVVPRSVYVLDPILLIMLMGGSRLAYRTWKEHRLVSLSALNAQSVLILGAGDAGATLAKELAKSVEWRVLGLLDDSVGKQGRQIHGLPVIGRIDELPEIARRLSVNHAIVAMPSATHTERRRAVDVCNKAGVKALTVPAFDDLVSGRVQVSAIRQVELDDLLGRDPVQLDEAGLQGLITGKTVLVTGAGGSIGAELCRQIARFRPGKLVLLELSEFALYQVEQEFAARLPDAQLVCAIGDVKDRARVDKLLAAHRPSVMFHAAAYKHVPLMEDDNAWQAVQNNAGGTLALAQAAIAHGVETFVLVSTDKAVNPTNVMGASKRLAEMVCQALQPAGGTRFVIVRFGNVLGSAGSVVPKFKAQIAAGGPITVTHPDITRYFMSIPEAAQLVLQAGTMGAGGKIFVLDMGEPVKIVDLAHAMIRLSGFDDSDIPVVFTGLRPGEKLYEELLADAESTEPTPHPKLRIARARAVDSAWLESFQVWLSAGPQPAADVRRQLGRWLPEYRSAGAPADAIVHRAAV
jgi:FlaA1/EpsC-like NDP-sugar epimerase